MGEVVNIGGVTRLAIPVDRVLSAALDAGLTGVIVVGEYGDGTEYFASSYAGGPETLWGLMRAQRKLLDIVGDD